MSNGSLVVGNKKGETIRCDYFIDSLLGTTKVLRPALLASQWFDEKMANKFLRHFADLWHGLVDNKLLPDGNKNENMAEGSAVEAVQKSLKAQIYACLPDTVKASLADNYWELIRYNPPKFVIGDKKYRQILSADYTTKKQRNEDDEETAGIDIHDPAKQVRPQQESITPSTEVLSSMHYQLV